MMDKIVGILVVVMLVLTAIVVIVPNNLKVEAVEGIGGDAEEYSLDKDFMWNVTTQLANVVHNYPDGMIPMGRAFATWGDNYTADYLNYTMDFDLCLEDVTKISIQNISDIEENYYKDFYYNYIVQPINFNLIINGDDYLYPDNHNVPINEAAVIPSGTKHYNSTQNKLSMDFINEFENAELVPMNLTYKRSFSDFVNCENLKVSYTQETIFTNIVANVSYVPIGEELPEEQENKVFFIDEEEGCEDQLNNITDIQGYLLIQVQYFDDSQLPGEWIVDNDTVNETTPRTIPSGEQLALDTIFNGLINTDDLTHGSGTYRIYAAFRDEYEDPLQFSSETSLVTWWEFEVT